MGCDQRSWYDRVETQFVDNARYSRLKGLLSPCGNTGHASGICMHQPFDISLRLGSANEISV